MLSINEWVPHTFGIGLLLYAVMVNDATGLLFYPVMMNLVLLLTFASSCLWGEPIITRIAKLREELDEAGLIYTRRLTMIWSVFFVVNGLIAAITTQLSYEIWTLYNGLISYGLIGLLLSSEWIYRKRKLG
ncbi:COG4648 family protein [Vibrio taketomensis]|uniref:COG4648 family protein n=1 Tax=Vibrio taketomensis TaxID=2572923 RepID=UPI0013895702|nr:hypothetical protein [Vibrio taketomensis]